MQFRGALLAVALGMALGACERDDDVVVVSRWQLATDDGAGQRVDLPARVVDRLGDAPSFYALATRVSLPARWRGKDLTLSIPHLLAHADLTVNGVDARRLDMTPRRGYRGTGGHVWMIPAAASGDADGLAIEIRVRHTWMQSGWLDTPPRLSASPGGDWQTRAAGTWNRWTSLLCIGTVFGTSFTFLVLFLLDRRRHEFGWSAFRIGATAAYSLFVLGIWQAELGSHWEVGTVLILLVWGGLAAVPSTAAQYGLGKTHAFWWALAIVCGALFVPLSGPFSASAWMLPLCTAALAITISFVLLRVARCARSGAHTGAVPDLLGWICLAVFTAPDFLPWLGVPEPLGGVRLGPFGLSLYALFQFVALSSAYIASIRTAERLNVELATANDELQRQIAERSNQLGDALARLASQQRGEAVRLEPGTLVDGRYRVAEALGEGAMGSVYKVVRTRDDTALALKLPTSSDASALARFAREAQLAAEIRSPHVVRIYDVGFASRGFMYLVMELVEGKSLKELQDQFGQEGWVTDAIADVARGVAAIHEQGIVHRDLKPANILSTHDDDGRVLFKIADFGVSTLAASSAVAIGVGGSSGAMQRLPSSPPAAAATDAMGQATATLTVSSAGASGSRPGTGPTRSADPMQLTQVGTIVGTPAYLAPELATGQPPSPASDVFGLGVMAFELLTGERPFDDHLVLQALRGAELSTVRYDLATRRPDLSPHAIETLERAVAPTADARPSASDIVEAFGRHSSTKAKAAL